MVDVSPADANRARNTPVSEVAQWREGAQCSRAVREYLDALDATNPVAVDAPGQAPATETASRHISPTDPAAQWTAAPGGSAFYAYSTNYLSLAKSRSGNMTRIPCLQWHNPLRIVQTIPTDASPARRY